MFTLYDNRNQLWQWDINRKVIVEDNTIDQVHFCNRTGDCSLVVEPYLEGNVYVADIPNILLQNDYPIKVYAYLSDGYTKVEECFKVKTRSKPADYIYTETEVLQYSSLNSRINDIESTYATKEYVAETIAGVEQPDVDLSNYYTKEETYNQEQVDAAIALTTITNADIWVKEDENITNVTQMYKQNGAIIAVQVVDTLPITLMLSNIETMTLHLYVVRNTGVAYIDVGMGAMSLGYILSDGQSTEADRGWLASAPTADNDSGVYCVPTSVPVLHFDDLLETVTGEETPVGDTLSWNGSTAGREVVSTSGDFGGNLLTFEYVHISDNIPTIEDLANGFTSHSAAYGVYRYEPNAEWSWLDVHSNENSISISHKDGLAVTPKIIKQPHTDSSGLTWTRAGTYFMKMSITKDGVTTPGDYVAAFNVPNYNFTTYAIETKIRKELLPEADVDLTGYATEQYVDNAINNIDIPDVPTKVSELENDAGYITEVPEEYITATELSDKGYVTEKICDIKTQLAKDGTTQLMKILTTDEEITRAFTIQQASDRLTTEGIIKWAGTADTYISSHSVLVNKGIRDWYRVDANGVVINIDSAPESYYFRPNVVYVSYDDAIYEYETEEVFRAAMKANLGSAPDLTGYATKEYVDTKGYQTEAQVTALINSALGEIENGSY